VPHAVVKVDRSGADIHVTDGVATSEVELTVEGDHDVLTKVPTGGTAQHRYQARVEDSWEHNAATVAAALEQLVVGYRPEVVLVMGDVRAAAELERHAGSETRSRMVRLDTGGRGAGTSEEAERDAIDEVLAAHRAAAEAEVVARFREQAGRVERAVEGLDAVTTVLQRAQVDELLLADEPTSSRTLWAGSGPLQIGTSRRAAEEVGARDPVEVRADAALAWAAACSDARVTLVDPGQVELADGVGALLRWSDESTPHVSVPSMPGHGQ
jgi:hypothetical protein